MVKSLAKLVAALCCIGCFAAPEKTDGKTVPDLRMQIWPRQKVAVWPTGLRQFVMLDVPLPEKEGALRLRLILPEGVTVLGFPDGTPPTMPPKSIFLKPSTFRQDQNQVTIDFPSGPRNGERWWVPLAIEVKAPVGEAILKVALELDGKELRSQPLPVKIVPALTGLRPKKIAVAAYDYHGLDEFSRPIYGEMMKQSGIRELHHMRGEPEGGGATVSDLGEACGFKNGLVFFTHHIQEYFAERPLSDGKLYPTGSHAWLLDHPEIFKEMIRSFFTAGFAGKPYTVVIFDAEAGGWRNNLAQNDLSPDGLAAFRRYAKLSEDTPLSAEIITEKYKDQWIAFICEQNLRTARLIREVLDESFPNVQFQAYSGYEYDDGPFRNRTRELYGTDWKTMRLTGIDAAVAGYCGNAALLRHTAEVTGNVPYFPAEMYVENYLSPRIGDLRPEVWSIRLIESFMAGSRRGLTLWYANVFDGGALAAIDRVNDFIARIEPMALSGKLDRESVKVMPESEEENVYVLRDGGKVTVVAINRTDTPKSIRLRLNLRLAGFTGELAISDAVSGEKIKPAKVIGLDVPAFGYRMLELMDDGN